MDSYTAIVERCPDTGLFVGYIPGFPARTVKARPLKS